MLMPPTVTGELEKTVLVDVIASPKIETEFWDHRHRALINNGGTITNEGD